MLITSAVSPSPFWFLTRGTGAISLVLLTVTVALGVANVRRMRIGDTPRFVLEIVHRNAALLAVSFVTVHVVTTLLDGYAPVAVLDAVIPFKSAYRPVWLGLGAVAFDLLLAVVITSLVRRRMGYRSWKTTHWLAYASWPVALVHGLGTGSDAKTHWMLLLTAGCVAIMLATVAARVSAGWPTHAITRLSALGAAAIVPLGLIVWLPAGPLSAGWAKRAGTPATLLASLHAGSQSGSGSSRSSHAGSGSGAPANAPTFTAPVTGRLRQVPRAGGVLIDIALDVHGQRLSRLRIRIQGLPINGGGVQMNSSRVTLGPAGNPDKYSGHITALQGSDVAAGLTGGGSALSLLARLQIDPGAGSVTGTVSAAPGGGP
jgi:methionine sulfoxide reductase heme-binding subunit